MSPVGAHRGDAVPVDPGQGGDVFHRLAVGRGPDHLRSDGVPGHDAEHDGGRLGVPVKAEAGPVLRIKAGGPHRAEHQLHRDRGYHRVPVGVQHGQGVAGGAAGDGHPVDGIAPLFRLGQDIGDAVPDLHRLGVHIGIGVLI